jgi:ribosomal protein L23
VTTKGKTQRTGRKRIAIEQPSTKKAMVMVKEGQSIAIFDVQDKK